MYFLEFSHVFPLSFIDLFLLFVHSMHDGRVGGVDGSFEGGIEGNGESSVGGALATH